MLTLPASAPHPSVAAVHCAIFPPPPPSSFFPSSPTLSTPARAHASMMRGVSKTSPRDIRKTGAGAAGGIRPVAFLHISELGSITDSSSAKKHNVSEARGGGGGGAGGGAGCGAGGGGGGEAGGDAGSSGVAEGDRSQVKGFTFALPPPVRPLVSEGKGETARSDDGAGGASDSGGDGHPDDGHDGADGDEDVNGEEDADKNDADGNEDADRDDDKCEVAECPDKDDGAGAAGEDRDDDVDGRNDEAADKVNDRTVSNSAADGRDDGPEVEPEAKLVRGENPTTSVNQEDRPVLTYTTGDASLRAGVVHAVTALGRYRVLRARRAGAPRSRARSAQSTADVFVVGRRPRRSVRLLLAMARGCWIVGDAWLLDSLHSRIWQPCDRYVPKDFPGVAAARAASDAGLSLLKGMLVGSWGTLDIDHDDFRRLVEAAGGQYSSAGAAVIVQGDTTGSLAADSQERALCVNQLWLPDSISTWRVQSYDEYAPE